MGGETVVRPAVFHILLALARGDMHGLGIAEAVLEDTDGTVVLGPGTLYRSLKEMVRDGLIEEAPAPSAGEDPRRRFYRLLPAVRDAARAEAGRLARIVDVARDNRVLPERL